MLDVTLAILAGGESSRMGASKAGLEIGGKPILEYLLDRMQWEGPTMLVSAPLGESLRSAGRFNRQVSDPIAGIGPLRGILTALENAGTSIVVITAVDMPMIARGQVEWVTKALIERPDAMGMMPARDVGRSRQVEPFPSAYRVSAAVIISEQLAKQRRAVHSLTGIPGFCVIDAPSEWPAKTWLNLNTPAELHAFLDDQSTV